MAVFNSENLYKGNYTTTMSPILNNGQENMKENQIKYYKIGLTVTGSIISIIVSDPGVLYLRLYQELWSYCVIGFFAFCLAKATFEFSIMLVKSVSTDFNLYFGWLVSLIVFSALVIGIGFAIVLKDICGTSNNNIWST